MFLFFLLKCIQNSSERKFNEKLWYISEGSRDINRIYSKVKNTLWSFIIVLAISISWPQSHSYREEINLCSWLSIKKIMQIWLLLPHIFPYREKDVIFFSGQEEQPTQLFLQWMGHTSMWKEGGRSRLCFYCEGSRSHMSMWKFLWQIFVSESYPSNHLFDLDRRAKEAANYGRTSLQRGEVEWPSR